MEGEEGLQAPLQEGEEEAEDASTRRAATRSRRASASKAVSVLMCSAQRVTRSMLKQERLAVLGEDGRRDGAVDPAHEAHIQHMAALRSRQQGY